jgi:DNA modification methylase
VTATAYAEFLATKAFVAPASDVEPHDTHPSLYPFQRAMTEWAIRRGRAAIFADCGLGKTRMQVEWVRQIGAPALIVAPLAVAEQTIAEAALMGVEIGGDITITNYERLHKYNPADYRAVVLDESSILKSVDGKTRTALIREWSVIPYRLCCTATPAPNDIAELANHAEFLGVMQRAEMLATFFVHDDRDWRLKGYAEESFWQWMALWAVYVRKPSDLGFDDAGFELPTLTIRDRSVDVAYVPDGELFPTLTGGIGGRMAARRASVEERVEAAIAEITTTDDKVLVWCGLNDESRTITAELERRGVRVESVEGADTAESKVASERRWRIGDAQVLVTKPSIFGFGMNWQHCHRMLFLGLGDSYEQYYQAIRRCWRFGQTEPVDAVIITSNAESTVVSNVRRKEADAARTAESVVASMREPERAAVLGTGRSMAEYEQEEATGDGWRLMLGDSVERLSEIKTGSVALSIFSPPFASLFTYSASDRDLGNSRDYEQFFEHFRYIIAETLRVTMPGRRSCVHVQQVTTTKATHGVIGWRDFRADTVRAHMDAGWVYDGEVVIDKDPQAQAIRTKSKALMFVQKNKDSAWSRPAMADYILLFRAPGENLIPVKCDVSNDEWISWARPIWYGIRESDTLNVQVARSEKDEKHIAPLQLGTIERCVRLWSNPGELVLSPFAGIGSEGYASLQLGRRFVGIELKRAYWEQARRNLNTAISQSSLFADEVPA